MRTIFYNKFLSGISISFMFSFLLKQFIFKSNYFFVYSASFFGALYLLLCWFTYLKSDGVFIFRKKTRSTSPINKFDRLSYKKKGIYNMDIKHDFNKTAEVSEAKDLKAIMLAYLACSATLFLASQLYFQHLTR